MARKDKTPKEPKLHPDDTVTKINSKDEIYDAVTVYEKSHKVIRYAIMAMVVVFIIYFTLLVVYWYDDFGEFNVTVDHECVFSEEGIYVPGTCQELGYTLYYCTEDWCDSYNKILDTEYAACKYLDDPIRVTLEDGSVYDVYTCSVCGDENWLLISSGE